MSLPGELFAQARQQLDHFFSHIDHRRVEALIEKLHAATGKFLLSGVGKSGIVARKVAATLVSTGSLAHFLSPADALHGDLGAASPGDVWLAFSKNGESEELISLAPHLKARGIETVALVSRLESRLARLADFAVELPVERELCPYDLAPTTSTTVQMVFGDVLALSLMERRRFTPDAFAKNHPAGFLGKKTTLQVADLMRRGEEVPRSSPHKLLIDVLYELSAKQCGCLLAVDTEERLIGIFTDGDLRRAIQKYGGEALSKPLALLMTPSPRTTSPALLAFDAMRQMQADPSRPITTLPVVEEGRLVGLLRMHDILQAGLH
jgi:arabinose-5-phosphate isomerase